jgi:hypothetical protein
MCRLFTQPSKGSDYTRAMHATIEPELPLMHPNKSPTDWALVVRRHPKTGERILYPLRFGPILYKHLLDTSKCVCSRRI